MSKVSDKRLFDADGNLVVGVGQPIPDNAKGLKPLDVTPADTDYPAGHPDDAEPDPVENRPAPAPAPEGDGLTTESVGGKPRASKQA